MRQCVKILFFFRFESSEPKSPISVDEVDPDHPIDVGSQDPDDPDNPDDLVDPDDSLDVESQDPESLRIVDEDDNESSL